MLTMHIFNNQMPKINSFTFESAGIREQKNLCSYYIAWKEELHPLWKNLNKQKLMSIFYFMAKMLKWLT